MGFTVSVTQGTPGSTVMLVREAEGKGDDPSLLFNKSLLTVMQNTAFFSNKTDSLIPNIISGHVFTML